MFPYQKEADEKYFNGYGVKLGSNENSKNSYVNSILQILINLDRKLSYELFFEIYSYEGNDAILSELKTILKEAAKIFEANKERMEALLDSDAVIAKSKGKFKKSSFTSEDPAAKEIDTSDLVAAVEESEHKSWLEPTKKTNKLWFFNVILLKYHQLFKDEFKWSFFQFSWDNEWTCTIHNFFGMKYRDTTATDPSQILAGNKFWISLDVSLLIEQLSKKDLK